ncbi:MAG: protein kinase [Myxococcota bacterium]
MMATNTASDSFNTDPLLDKTVGGRYAIERLIGRGGVGLVYLAQDKRLSRQVVIKVLAPHWASDGDAVARFDREAQRMARLDHINVVKMFDHGHFEGRTYIVMEFIRGEPLSRYLSRRKRMPLEEFIPIASQILLGAGYVHERGIMMRDIKPPNIMLCERQGKANHVKLLDFGLAKLIEEDEEDEITKAHVIGTAAYMSPEQIRGDKIDVRVDVYALGVLFFLMLTGEQPISGDNDAAVLVNHVHGKPKSLVERLPKGHRLPPRLVTLVESCLAKDPDQRPKDAAAMADALFEILPAPLFELPEASLKTRAPAETYWAARMHSGSAAVAAIQQDVSDSAEWTRPLLRRAAKTGEAPLKLAEEEIEAQKEQVQRPIKKPRPRSPTGSGLKSRPRSPTGPEPKPQSRATAYYGAPPAPPVMPRPRPATKKSVLGTRPGSATVRVTAADAREAVERVRDRLDRAESEASDAVPISVDLEDLEELEELEDIETTEPTDVLDVLEEASTVEAVEDEDDAAARSGTQPLPTTPLQPVETEALGVLSSGGYMLSAPPPQSDGMRLGAMVAVAGLAALVLGGLTAWLVLDGGDPPSEAAMPAVAVSAPGPDAVAAPAASPEPVEQSPVADVGTVEVQAIDGARVEIDGDDRGEVPISVELPLGKHRVKVTAPGYHPWQTTIDVKPGANAAVTAELVEAEATPAAKVDEPAPKPKATKRAKPRSSKSKPKDDETKTKTKSKSGVFMDPSKKKGDGIFMPVGGK